MGRRPNMSLDQLTELSGEELNAEWARRYGAPAPKLSPDQLRLGVAYKLQEAKLGGISRTARSLLRQTGAKGSQGNLTKPTSRKLTAGTRLVRDWHGVGHTVVVVDDGFQYEGKHWRSLSAIAKAITGQHWNGPLFFGLSGRKK